MGRVRDWTGDNGCEEGVPELPEGVSEVRGGNGGVNELGGCFFQCRCVCRRRVVTGEKSLERRREGIRRVAALDVEKGGHGGQATARAKLNELVS